MKFNRTAPCAHCPFRRDVPGYLRPQRAAELAEQMERDDTAWFACHETTGKGRGVRHKQAAMCAGLMILQEKIGSPNVAMRVAYAVGLLVLERLNLKAPVFDSFQEFVSHHTEAYWGKRWQSGLKQTER